MCKLGASCFTPLLSSQRKASGGGGTRRCIEMLDTDDDVCSDKLRSSIVVGSY